MTIKLTRNNKDLIFPDGTVEEGYSVTFEDRGSRNAIIEECARVAESLAKNQWDNFAQDALDHAAKAIRALKDKP